MRALTPATLAFALGLAAALSGCDSRPAAPSNAAPVAGGCTAVEMRSRRARTPSCAAQFQALLDKAEADRRRGAAITPAPAAPARDRF